MGYLEKDSKSAKTELKGIRILIFFICGLETIYSQSVVIGLLSYRELPGMGNNIPEKSSFSILVCLKK